MIDLVAERENKTEARYTVEAYYKGFRVFLTQPFENGAAIVGLLDKMLGVGYSPRPTMEKPIIENKEFGKETESHMYPIHNVEMKKWEKNNKIWYSHKADGVWCTGKRK